MSDENYDFGYGDEYIYQPGDEDYSYTPTYDPDFQSPYDNTGNFTGGESQDHDLTSSEALVGQGYTQDEVGNWYKVGPGGQYSFIGGDGKTYNYDTTKGGFVDASGNAAGASTNLSLGNTLKKLFTKTDAQGGTSLNTSLLGAIGGGLLGATGLGQMDRQPTGYQGKIPKLVATRQAPGPGQQLSGNVTYSPAPVPAPAQAPVQAAKGGSLDSGGFVVPADVVSHLGNGSSDAGLRILAQKLGAAPIKGDGDGMSDSIETTIDGRQPARVANEEARLTKAQVDAAGGAKKLYAMMDKIRQARTGSKEQGKQIDPSKYVPGGTVRGYAEGGVTGSALSAGLSGSESNLSNWAGDYVTGMLGKGQALSEMPFEQYSGPLTAGPSALQTQAFNTAGTMQVPSAIGQAGTTAGGIAGAAQNMAYNPVGSDFGTAQAQQYMNPYLKASLDPQLAELQRQNQMANMQTAGQLTKAGAYGGSRQAVMNAENQRNMLDKTGQLVSQGYNTAYDKAMAQFNADQARKTQEAQFGSTFGLQGLQTGLQAAQAQGQLGATQQQADINQLKSLADLGATQQGLSQADISAQRAAFEEARVNPYKMVQFQQSLLQGLPLAAQSYNVAQPSTLQQILSGAGGGASMLGGTTGTDLNTALKNLGIIS